jgi:cell division protein FtsB
MEKYVAENLASLIASQAMLIGNLKDENEQLKLRNSQLQETVNNLRKKVKENESSPNKASNK